MALSRPGGRVAASLAAMGVRNTVRRPGRSLAVVALLAVPFMPRSEPNAEE